MVKEVVTRKREPIGHYGKPLHGGTPMQDATKSYALTSNINRCNFKSRH